MTSRRVERAASLLGLLLLGASAWFLQRELRNLDVAGLLRFLRTIPAAELLLAVVWALAGYAVIFGYDALGTRYVGARLTLPRLLLTSFVSGAFSNSVSLPLLGVGGMRFRFYTAWGLDAERLARLVLFVGVGSWLGLMLGSGVAFLMRPPDLPLGSSISSLVMRTIGAVFLAIVATNLLFCAWRSSLRIWRWTLPLPSVRLALGQTVLGTGEWLAQALLLYALLPAGEEVPPGWFLSAFFVAMIAAMIGHVPAGLGIFDSGTLWLMSPLISHEHLLGVLILYRLIYHLGPLALALLLLGGFELRQRLQSSG